MKKNAAFEKDGAFALKSAASREAAAFDGVPVAFCATRKKTFAAGSENPQLQSFSFEKYKNKQVEILVSGFWVQGKLIGADEENLYLRGLHRWWVYPLEKITEMRLLDGGPEVKSPLGATPKDSA